MLPINIPQIVLHMRKANRGTFRMDDCTPSECHIWDVMEIYADLYGIEDLSDDVAGGIILHDTVEDHAMDGYDEPWLRRTVPADMADIVMWLTKSKRPEGVEKLAFANAIYSRLGREGPLKARKIKVSDRLANLKDPEVWSANFRRFYIADTQNLIVALDGTPRIEVVRHRLDVIRNAA